MGQTVLGHENTKESKTYFPAFRVIHNLSEKKSCENYDTVEKGYNKDTHKC